MPCMFAGTILRAFPLHRKILIDQLLFKLGCLMCWAVPIQNSCSKVSAMCRSLGSKGWSLLFVKNPCLSDDNYFDWQEHIKSEIQHQLAMDHPNICRLLEVLPSEGLPSVDPSGHFYSTFYKPKMVPENVCQRLASGWLIFFPQMR